MLSATLSHTQIAAVAASLKPQYVTHPGVSVEQMSQRLAVSAIDQSGTFKNFNVCVPLSIAYRPQMAAQSTLDKVLEQKWTVLSALSTDDRF